MKKLTIKEKANGEMAIRGMSKKAQAFFNETDPLAVAKLSDGSISIRGAFGDFDDLSEKECEELFENWYDEINSDDEE